MGLYEDRVLPSLIDFAMSGRLFDRLRARTAVGLHGTVVELGFGSGLNLPHYPAAVERVLAIDPALRGRRIAAKRLAASPIEVTFPGLDGQTLPLEDASCDGALVTWTLCTIPDPGRALAELRRVLKPGAAVHFVEHGRSEVPGVAAWQARLNPIQGFFAGGCRLDRAVDEDLRGAGFTIEALDRFCLKRTPRWVGTTYLGVARSAAP